jgi:hypothetical protein
MMPLSSIVKDLERNSIGSPPTWGGFSRYDVRRTVGMVELAGIEPAASGLQNRRSPN